MTPPTTNPVSFRQTTLLELHATSVEGAKTVSQIAINNLDALNSEKKRNTVSRTRTSAIWDNCSLVSNAEGRYITCNNCTWSNKYSGGTTCAKSHNKVCTGRKSYSSNPQVMQGKSGFQTNVSLRDDVDDEDDDTIHHSLIVDLVGGEKTFTQSQSILFQNRDGSMGSRNKVSDLQNVSALRGALAEMVLLDELPFTFCEGEGFKNFCQLLRPQFNLPGRKTVKSDIDDKVFPRIQQCIQEQILKQVSLDTKFNFTTDIWTAPHLDVGFMAITVHFIDEEWNLRQLLLTFEEIDVPHSGTNIAQVFKQCLLDFGIPQQNVMSCTLDNASNNTSFIASVNEVG